MRFDAARFFREVDQRRRDRSLSWRELARKLSISPSTFSRMSQGRRPDIETFLKLITWLGSPAETFVDGIEHSEPAQHLDTLGQILRTLRSDSSLAPDDADALQDIVRVAYRRFSQPSN